MKNLLVMLAVVCVMLVASCTQRTCPTYTKGTKELKPVQNTEASVLKKV